jgi:hypothetical protein
MRSPRAARRRPRRTPPRARDRRAAAPGRRPSRYAKNAGSGPPSILTCSTGGGSNRSTRRAAGTTERSAPRPASPASISDGMPISSTVTPRQFTRCGRDANRISGTSVATVLAAVSACAQECPATKSRSTVTSGFTSRTHGRSRSGDALRRRDAVTRVHRDYGSPRLRGRARARPRRCPSSRCRRRRAGVARRRAGPTREASRRRCAREAPAFHATTTALMRGAVMRLSRSPVEPAGGRSVDSGQRDTRDGAPLPAVQRELPAHPLGSGRGEPAPQVGVVAQSHEPGLRWPLDRPAGRGCRSRGGRSVPGGRRLSWR